MNERKRMRYVIEQIEKQYQDFRMTNILLLKTP